MMNTGHTEQIGQSAKQPGKLHKKLSEMKLENPESEREMKRPSKKRTKRQKRISVSSKHLVQASIQ
jgi:hypothetical protein